MRYKAKGNHPGREAARSAPVNGGGATPKTRAHSLYGWTQPICFACFHSQNPNRVPVRVRGADTERCVHCDEETREGIYIRIDPDIAPHPSILR